MVWKYCRTFQTAFCGTMQPFKILPKTFGLETQATSHRTAPHVLRKRHTGVGYPEVAYTEAAYPEVEYPNIGY